MSEPAVPLEDLVARQVARLLTREFSVTTSGAAFREDGAPADTNDGRTSSLGSRAS
jgi:hypothetical protein